MWLWFRRALVCLRLLWPLIKSCADPTDDSGHMSFNSKTWTLGLGPQSRSLLGNGSLRLNPVVIALWAANPHRANT